VSDGEVVVSDDETLKRKKEKKKKEKEHYKSAQFIEDSDEEYGDIEAFLEKEKAMREKTARIASEAGGSIGTMKPTGTKKRRRKLGGDTGGKKKRKGAPSPVPVEDKPIDESQSDSSESDIVLTNPVKIPNDPSPPAPRARPRPRPITKRIASNRSDSVPPSESSPPSRQFNLDDTPEGVEAVAMTSRRRIRLVISDEEDN
jgi:replication fork protection complex subunit Tof1/Swi1